MREPADPHPAARVAGADRDLAGRAGTPITRLTLPVPALLVVGSKGKGTAVAAASHALHRLGHRVGTVTSPPLRWAGERVRIDGRALSDAQYREMSARVAGVLESMPGLDLGTPDQGAPDQGAPDGTVSPECAGYLPPSGLYTLAGIRCLLDAGVTALVIEEGLGGLSDEVSLFDYPVVAVTQIFAEHTDVLGGSLESVAADLLGVVSAATRTVLSYSKQPDAVGEILGALEFGRDAEAAAGPSVDVAGVRGRVGSRVRSVGAEPAGITATNIRLGVEAALALIGDSPAAAAEALSASAHAELRLPARLSRHEARGLTWFVDAGINPAGVRAALAGVRRAIADPGAAGAATAAAPAPESAPEPIVIAGFPDTKDVDACLAELSGLPDANVILAGAGADYLSYETARRHQGRYGPVRDVPTALELAERLTRAAANPAAASGVNPASAPTPAILTVGTMSFAGQVLDALDADVDSWWA